MMWTVPIVFTTSHSSLSNPLQNKIEQNSRDLWNDIQLAKTYLFNIIGAADHVASLRRNRTIAPLDVLKHPLFKAEIPQGIILYPGVDQCVNSFPEIETANYNPLPPNPVFLREIEKEVRVFESKDKPFLLRFKCSDGERRGFIVKSVVNSASESILANIIAREYKQHLPRDRPEACNFYPGFNEKIKFFRVLALTDKVLCIEEVPDSATPLDLEKTMKSQYESSPDVNPSLFYDAIMDALYGNKNYLEAFEQREVFNFSIGLWFSANYAFGMGDRHLSNMMIHKPNGTLFNIDFELMLGGGRDLPVPEVVSLRLSPVFRKLFGILEIGEVFKNILASFMEHLSKRRMIILCEFLELCLHAGERSFSNKSELFTIDYIRRELDKALLLPDNVHCQQDRRAYWSEHVFEVIERSSDEAALNVMFQGWKPQV